MYKCSIDPQGWTQIPTLTYCHCTSRRPWAVEAAEMQNFQSAGESLLVTKVSIVTVTIATYIDIPKDNVSVAVGVAVWDL